MVNVKASLLLPVELEPSVKMVARNMNASSMRTLG